MTSTCLRIARQTIDDMSNFHQVFPLIVFEKEMTGFLPELYKSFDDHKFDNSDGKVTGELNGKVLVHQDRRLHPFFKQLRNAVIEYLEYFSIDPQAFNVNFTKTWFTICDPGQSFPSHYHSCAHLSFVYYIQTPGDPLVIQHQNPNEWFGAAFSFVTENKWNNGSAYAITPKAEHLVIFPGKTEHYTEPEERKYQRISLAGDIVLTLKRNKFSAEAGLLNPGYWKQF